VVKVIYHNIYNYFLNTQNTYKGESPDSVHVWDIYTIIRGLESKSGEGEYNSTLSMRVIILI